MCSDRDVYSDNVVYSVQFIVTDVYNDNVVYSVQCIVTDV